MLWADTAEHGWTPIAMLLNVDFYAINQMIADGSILAPPAADLDGLFG